MDATALYMPINTLKRVCDDVWIVDGPAVKFGFGWPKFTFTTRMTLVRLGTRLFVHSPTELVEPLRAQVNELGTVAWIIGPNRIHYSWLVPWHKAYPKAAIYLAPKIDKQMKVDFPHTVMQGDCGYPWDEEIATLPIESAYMTEIEFFHRASRTLILTDLVENFESEKLPGLTRLITYLGAVTAPHGGMAKDMRMTFIGRKTELRKAIERMIEWDPCRIIISHGRWFQQDGTQELRRAFAWLLK